jgi:hypothetical protein
MQYDGLKKITSQSDNGQSEIYVEKADVSGLIRSTSTLLQN